MLSKKLEDAINEQIRVEFHSAYIYLSMSAYCETINFPGAASWLQAQNIEETEHGMKLFTFVNDRGGHAKLKELSQPQVHFDSLLDIFETSLNHEKNVSEKIYKLYELAIEEKDYPTQVMLQWFIQEQVEEEKTVSDIVENLKMAGSDSQALLLLDKELQSRSANDA